MNAWVNTVLTDQGRVLMAKLTQGHTLNITRAVAGAGFVTPGLLPKQTEVTDPKQTLIFRAATYPETGVCKIPVVLYNEQLTVGYKATQVGIYAIDPDDGEILLFISQSADAASGAIVPSATEMAGYSAGWTFYLRYGQADGVNITVDPSAAVSHEEMEEYVRNNTFSQKQIEDIIANSTISQETMEAFVNDTFTPISDEEIEAIFEDYGGPVTGGGVTLETIDFSNVENGTFTEILSDGSEVPHTITFDGSGRPVAIDDITIKW